MTLFFIIIGMVRDENIRKLVSPKFYESNFLLTYIKILCCLSQTSGSFLCRYRWYILCLNRSPFTGKYFFPIVLSGITWFLSLKGVNVIPNLKKKHKKEKLRTYLLHRLSEVQILEYLTLKVEDGVTFCFVSSVTLVGQFVCLLLLSLAYSLFCIVLICCLEIPWNVCKIHWIIHLA